MGGAQKTAPLQGKRVLVTRAVEQAASTVDLLRARGADPVVVPTLEIHPPRDPASLDRALVALRAGAYAWVLFTSANGVDATWTALEASGGDAGAFAGVRLGAVGTATAKALARRGLSADVVAKQFRGEGLAEALLAAPRAAGSGAPRALLARAAKASDVLPTALRAAGWTVDVAVAYETRPPAPSVAEGLVRDLERGGIDAVVFTSGSTVDHLCDLLGPRAVALLAEVRVASIGPITSAAAIERGLRVDVTAPEATVAALVQALEESWA